jgi:hypothetical protein
MKRGACLAAALSSASLHPHLSRHLDERSYTRGRANPSVLDRVFLAGVRPRREDRSAAGALEEAIASAADTTITWWGPVLPERRRERPVLAPRGSNPGRRSVPQRGRNRWPMVVAVRDRSPVQALLRKYRGAPR